MDDITISGSGGRKMSQKLEINSDAWKAYVANAMAKPPGKRTKREREAIQMAMAMWTSERAPKH